MNLFYLFVIFIFCSWLWHRSGAGVINKPAHLALMIILLFWWFFWGQLAVSDQWWIYNNSNLVGFRIGSISIIDLFYFLAGIGWNLYWGKRLKII